MADKWDIRFLKLAKEISSWSKDPSSKIGCVLVDKPNKRILSTGYNGFPANIEDTSELLQNREEKYKRIIHAEMNSLLNALEHGIKVRGSYCYIYGLPLCGECAKMLIQGGISKVFIGDMDLIKREKWKKMWETVSKPLLQEGNIEIEIVDQTLAGDSWKSF